MSRFAGTALLLLLLILVAGAGGSAAVTSTPQPSELLATYAPVLLFHPAERWAPEPVESYLQIARTERQVAKGHWSTVDGPLPTSSIGCILTPCLRLNLPCALRSGIACYQALAQQTDWDHPTVYGTVATVPANTAPPAGFTSAPKLLVHYWLFYAFDDWHSARNRLWQTHEGDWESITVGIGQDDQPQFAAYSEHCSGTVLPWQAVIKRGATHPVSYVALGSHANWFSGAASNTRFGECLRGNVAATKAAGLIQLAQEAIVDRMGATHPLGPAGLPGVTPYALVELKPATSLWARFPGRWGEGQILWLGSKPRRLTTVSQGYGPSTPHWGATTVSASWHPATS